jgi:hypothetical protein
MRKLNREIGTLISEASDRVPAKKESDISDEGNPADE